MGFGPAVFLHGSRLQTTVSGEGRRTRPSLKVATYSTTGPHSERSNGSLLDLSRSLTAELHILPISSSGVLYAQPFRITVI